MIYTVTFNPAIDYVVHLPALYLCEVNRSDYEEFFYGGKGINVSTVLHNLGEPNVALGFVGGYTGKALLAGLKRRGIDTDFIELEHGLTRINVKIKARGETDINGQGPEIDAAAFDELCLKLDKIKSGDFLILAGSVPDSMPDDAYERIMRRLEGRGINIVVDATKGLLLNVLEHKPFLIKPNKQELAEMFDARISSRNDIVEYAKRLQEMGAKNVLVSLASEGAILITESGEVLRMGVPLGSMINSVGAGDSMVAGFVLGYIRSGSYAVALKLGIACGSATAFSPGLCGAELVEKLYGEL